jgi:hypothetical protein
MRRSLPTLALLLAVPVICAQAPSPAADYALTVRVVSSHLMDDCSATCVWAQHLNVTINGKKYELEDTNPRTDLIRPGDYKAKILEDKTTLPYAYLRTYEFLFPDGQARRYIVVGEGD